MTTKENKQVKQHKEEDFVRKHSLLKNVTCMEKYLDLSKDMTCKLRVSSKNPYTDTGTWKYNKNTNKIICNFTIRNSMRGPKDQKISYSESYDADRFISKGSVF